MFLVCRSGFSQVKGVHAAISGYMGGRVTDPSYEQVCTGTTGHAEVVQVKYDASIIGYREVLEIFFAVHDPTTLNRQGADVGTQYRSAIFTHSPEQRLVAQSVIEQLTQEQLYPQPIVTQVVPVEAFYPAEGYHQGYYQAHPLQGYCQAVISPKLAKFRQKFAARLQDSNAK
jgi:peptide-methionine (S)-S-oxide reductase